MQVQIHASVRYIQTRTALVRLHGIKIHRKNIRRTQRSDEERWRVQRKGEKTGITEWWVELGFDPTMSHGMFTIHAPKWLRQSCWLRCTTTNWSKEIHGWRFGAPLNPSCAVRHGQHQCAGEKHLQSSGIDPLGEAELGGEAQASWAPRFPSGPRSPFYTSPAYRPQTSAWNSFFFRRLLCQMTKLSQRVWLLVVTNGM